MIRRLTVAAFLFLFFPSVFARPRQGQGTPSAADYLRRAQAHLDQKDYGQARAAAQNAVRLDPRSAEAEHLLGRAEYGLGHLDAARLHLEHALALDPGLIAAHQQLAELFVGEGAYELAIPELERLRKLEPESSETSYNLALAYHRAGRQAEAAALLESLLAHQDDAELEDLLGEVDEKLGKLVAALAAYRRAADLEPQNEDYRFDYAQALAGQGAVAPSLEAFAAAGNDFPQSVRIWLGWGAAYYLAGRYQDAARTLLHAAEIAPQAREVYYLLGRAYDAAGPLQDAVTERFARYLGANPKDAWAECFYGRMLAARGRQGSAAAGLEAQRHLERALELDGNLAEAHAELGHVFEMRGRLEAARAELERAVQIDPQSSAAYYRLAEVYRSLGERARAQEAVGKFQQLKAEERTDPDRERIRGFFERGKR